MVGSNCSYNYVYLCIQCSLSLHSNTAIGEVYWIQRHVQMFINYIHIKLIYQWTKYCTIIFNPLNLITYIFCDILIFLWFYGFSMCKLCCSQYWKAFNVILANTKFTRKRYQYQKNYLRERFYVCSRLTCCVKILDVSRCTTSNVGFNRMVG